ncbi:MAG: opioid growth factor receptor-related protein [Syntrophaceae bacterium]|nr:opioid growth factor receptor-related protein [Syntrophaceae bacterium]
MSKLIDFYQDSGEPFDWEDIIYNWDNEKLESNQEYFRWLFPLDLSVEEVEEFRNDVDLTDRLETSLRKFLEFLGLSLVRFGKQWIVAKSATFSSRRVAVWTHSNHNWQRITHLLKSLRSLGRNDLANPLLVCLKQLRDREGIAASGFAEWEAVK